MEEAEGVRVFGSLHADAKDVKLLMLASPSMKE